MVAIADVVIAASILERLENLQNTVPSIENFSSSHGPKLSLTFAQLFILRAQALLEAAFFLPKFTEKDET
jgi:hypothetical protein